MATRIGLAQPVAQAKVKASAISHGGTISACKVSKVANRIGLAHPNGRSQSAIEHHQPIEAISAYEKEHE